MHFFKALGALALAPSVLAQNVTECSSNGVCYAINIPESTAASGSGDIFIQMSGPTSMSWIGLGQGAQMKNANIFMIYANAAGTNVTLSPRHGIGEEEPITTDGPGAILLSGSGISNGMMHADIKCSNCTSWTGGTMDLTDANSKWIWAYMEGSPVSSDDPDTRVGMHTNYGEPTFNLQQARGGNSANPFVQVEAVAAAPGSSSSSSSSSIPSNFYPILYSHAVLATLAFALFMPLGAIAVRTLSFKGLIWLHAGWMSFAYLMALTAMGLGIWLAITIKKLDSYHAIIGLVVICGLSIQPITGLAHHMLYKRRGGPNVATWPHILWGRAIITLAIINGGFGLQLAGMYHDNKAPEIAYGVIAGVIWVIWMAVIAISFVKSRGKKEGEKGDNLFGRTSGTRGSESDQATQRGSFVGSAEHNAQEKVTV
ncbi:hypothetical protein LSUE1_G005086 [Lachnellula suecica]|uniref:Cytochrome b561 domain-containing protein n=1 Tax=Lachnellula suecica TaxID=602035 RepID=A0A8T9C8Z8_9HELO|nr:hypothetical protein LSUE1_G005086 [Lachnellula suecica]